MQNSYVNCIVSILYVYLGYTCLLAAWTMQVKFQIQVTTPK